MYPERLRVTSWGQQEAHKTLSISRNKKGTESNTLEQSDNDSFLSGLHNKNPAWFHGPDRPKEVPYMVECRLLPYEKRVEEKKVTKGEILRIIDSANYMRKFSDGGICNNKPQLKSTYNPIAFPPLTQLSNHRGMMAPYKGISAKGDSVPYQFLTYASGNGATNTVDHLTPHKVLQDPMMSTFSPNLIAYIADMVSLQVQ